MELPGERDLGYGRIVTHRDLLETIDHVPGLRHAHGRKLEPQSA